MLVRLLTGPSKGETRHVELNQTTSLMLETGMIEKIEPPKPAPPKRLPGIPSLAGL
jgi:hypothetical protein